MSAKTKLRIYYGTAILSLVFAVAGFSYNAWRMEVTESNSNVRTAAFEALTLLAELEQVVYFAHYDQDPVEGSPRRGWIKVGLIQDMSVLIDGTVVTRATDLTHVWSQRWPDMASDREATDEIVAAIDNVRMAIKKQLASLH